MKVLPLDQVAELADTRRVGDKPTNEGEGSREADRRYREAAERFAAGGPVEQAAAEAARAIDDPSERAALEEAAEAGKARAAGHDPDEGPYPVFWSDDHASSWARIRDALALDWLQTRFDLGLPGGVDLEQDVSETIEQITTSPERRALTWEEAQPAVRLGHGAARHFPERRWDRGLEELLQAEWLRMDTSTAWRDARRFVHDGWKLGRRDDTVPFRRP